MKNKPGIFEVLSYDLQTNFPSVFFQEIHNSYSLSVSFNLSDNYQAIFLCSSSNAKRIVHSKIQYSVKIFKRNSNEEDLVEEAQYQTEFKFGGYWTLSEEIVRSLRNIFNKYY